MPQTLNNIGAEAFAECENLTSAVILSALSIGRSAFRFCNKLEFVNLPNSLNSMGATVFADCPNLVSINIPVSLETIPNGLFNGCEKLAIDEIPNNVSSIGNEAFLGCKSISSMVLPNSISSIGSYAFYDCTGLNTVISQIEDPFAISNDVFDNTVSVNHSLLMVPHGTKSKYEQFIGWTHRFNVIKETPIVYSLVVKSTGNGYVTYKSTKIRNASNTFEVEEKSNVTLSFTPDNGYRLKSVKVNTVDVTSNVSNNQYTISSISENTSVEVVFEAISYTLYIKATGNGSASYDGTTIRSTTTTFTVNGGTSATISFAPDNGHRIKSVTLNNADVTSNVSNNQYTISSICANTTLAVEFEAIPPTTYTLSIKATGNGSVIYENSTIKNQTRTFIVSEGSYASVALSPENGYRVKSVKKNNEDVTTGVNNSKYTISNITSNTSFEVEFEAIPIPTYTLTITAFGNGSVTYDETTLRDQSRQFAVNEGTTVITTFNPDNGNAISSVKVDGTDVTSSLTGNRYVVREMIANTTIEVTFAEDINSLTVDGINYTVTSLSNKTVKVVGFANGQVLIVPATVMANGATWKVIGIDNDVLLNNVELAAVIWEPETQFTASVSNPNLLLYVKAEEYATTAIRNVVVNGTAANIVLVDAISGNAFYCPQSFTAQKISYQHSYNMTTGFGESRGWETIALPFDVQTITHSEKGSITPFANWYSSDDSKPFWLYELTGTGFATAGSIQAYKPYIISMPNNPKYDSPWKLNGTITFSASNVTIGKTDDVQTNSYHDRTFVPNFMDRYANEGCYALNVNNDYSTNNSGMAEGSKFVLNMRQIHPFEAYMTTTLNARGYFDVFEDMETAIKEIEQELSSRSKDVYDLQGRKVSKAKKGLYIINGRKNAIK